MRIIIADDEPALLDQLARTIEDCDPQIEIVGLARNGREALQLAQEHEPDAAFLDIRMPGLTGLEVAEQLSVDVKIVFVTAYDQYAIDAFEAAAADYVLKPVTPERLTKTINRLREDTPPADHAALKTLIQTLASAQKSTHLQWLRVAKGDATHLVNVSDVLYFEADHKYTTVVTNDASYLVRMSIKSLEEELDEGQFWRVHRSYIVNAANVTEARRDLRGRYVLSIKGSKKVIRTSQAYGHLFKQM